MATEVENDDSLIALTSHFAQVQFRLKQIISAEPSHKEELLKELEQFAFQGCGSHMTYDTAASGENGSTESQHSIRFQLMQKLQHQLDDIEKCTKEVVETDDVAASPAEGGTGNSIAEKQKVIIGELRKRFHFQFGENLESVSAEEIKMSVDRAVKEVVDPIRSNETYAVHLQGQIKDLERYITFLHTRHTCLPPDPETPASQSHDTSHDLTVKEPHLSSVHSVNPKCVTFSAEVPVWECGHGDSVLDPPVPQYRLSMTQLDGVNCKLDNTQCELQRVDSLQTQFEGPSKGPDDWRLSLLVMKKTLAVMEILTLCQCGGSLKLLPRYVADDKRKRYHLALQSLEMAVDKIAIITSAFTERDLTKESKISLETDLHETVSMCLADSLRVLLEHGLLASGNHSSLTAGCLPLWSRWGHGFKGSGEECLGWRVMMHYYKMKNGDNFSLRTDQMLMTAFDLPVGYTSVKKTLLLSINKVEQMYKYCAHRSSDTKFRALISEGFNLGHLYDWFKVIASHPSVGDDLYTSSAFFVATGFRPALSFLERLKDNPTSATSLCVALPLTYYQNVEAFFTA